jgi:LysR family hydrogen peroxide-inducible transcriptional activator
MPTLRQLRFLTALAEHGSFVAAAQAIGVTQPTLSAGIKELEGLLGATLVDRARGGSILTPAGRDCADRATRILSEAEDLVMAIRGVGGPLIGAFRLGCIPTIAPFLLPRALPGLRQRFARARFQLREDKTARLVEGLKARTLDAAIIALPWHAPGIETESVADDEFLFAAPPGHPLSERTDLTPDLLASQDLLLLEDGHCLRDHAVAACAVPRTPRALEVAATSLHTLVHMVGGGLGVSLVPRLAAEGGVTAGADVTLTPFARPLIGRQIGVAWRAGSARAPDARAIAASLRDSLRQSD